MKQIFILLCTFSAFAGNSIGQVYRQVTPKSITPRDMPTLVDGTGTQLVITKPSLADVYMCIDAIQAPNMFPKLPVAVNQPLYNLLPNGTIQQVVTIQQPLSSSNEFRWAPNENITIGFYKNETTDSIIEVVKKYATDWLGFVNVNFQWVDDVNTAMVKVGFKQNKTSWSWLGRQVLSNPTNSPTMNFGWFNSKTPDKEFQRVVRHEFGHVLGFVHEHQSPNAGINWNKDSVYKFFAAQNWDKITVDQNVFDKYSKTQTNSSAYDPLSIMHYASPAILTTDGFSSPSNINFSATDRVFAKKIYEITPPPRPRPQANCILQTGDDCDYIEVVITYWNENPINDNITFQLELGQINETKPILTWWKQIGIPLLGNTERTLELPAGNKNFAGIQIPLSQIDISKGFSFSKAKVLGVHTPLNFKWNVWPAITPGCTVHFIWKRDSCY
jgi:Astacin (Peptidase family M12A)